MGLLNTHFLDDYFHINSNFLEFIDSNPYRINYKEKLILKREKQERKK